jgi:hypothetical protein
MYPYSQDHTFQPTEGEPKVDTCQQQFVIAPRNSLSTFAVGDLIIFPGYVPHSVDATPGPDPRVAIAFNLDVSLLSIAVSGLILTAYVYQGDPNSWREMTDVFQLRDIVDRANYYTPSQETSQPDSTTAPDQVDLSPESSIVEPLSQL